MNAGSVLFERLREIKTVVYDLRGGFRVIQNGLEPAGFLAREGALDDEDAAFDGVAEREERRCLRPFLFHRGFRFAVEFPEFRESGVEPADGADDAALFPHDFFHFEETA